MTRTSKKPRAVWTDYKGRKIDVVLVNYVPPIDPYGFPQSSGYHIKVTKSQEPYRRGFEMGAVSAKDVVLTEAGVVGTWMERAPHCTPDALLERAT